MPPKKIKDNQTKIEIKAETETVPVTPKKAPKKSTKKVQEESAPEPIVAPTPTPTPSVTTETKKAPRKNKKNVEPVHEVKEFTPELAIEVKGKPKKTTGRKRNTELDSKQSHSLFLEEKLSPYVINNIIYRNACEYNKLMTNINNNTDIPDNLIEIMAFIVMPLNDFSIYTFWEKSDNKFGGRINLEKIKEALEIED
jgi:hypothetical protein